MTDELEMEEIPPFTDIMVMKVVASYLQHVIDPQPTIDLRDLAHLEIEDLIDYEIPKELFTIHEYTKDEVKRMMLMLSKIIRKMEDNKIDNI
jgi:hypothetical protein